jgi:hypothetical protein
MKFNDLYVSRDHRFSLGVEETIGRFYASIPLSNAMVDYEEYYEVDHTTLVRFQINLEQALAFVTLCRQRKVDDLLMVQPGENHGTAI